MIITGKLRTFLGVVIFLRNIMILYFSVPKSSKVTRIDKCIVRPDEFQKSVLVPLFLLRPLLPTAAHTHAAQHDLKKSLPWSPPVLPRVASAHHRPLHVDEPRPPGLCPMPAALDCRQGSFFKFTLNLTKFRWNLRFNLTVMLDSIWKLIMLDWNWLHLIKFD
jgi:hypothetical protein